MGKVTNPNKSQHKKDLSIEQLNAIDLLILGKTDKEVAEAVGVHRCTVTSWRLYNPYFQAELNRRRKEVWSAAVDRFRSLLKKALDTVEKALDGGDAKTAIELLRMAGLDMKDGSLGTYLVGEEDPEKILEKLAEAKKQEELYRQLTPQPTDWEKKSTLNELEELARRLERLQP